MLQPGVCDMQIFLWTFFPTLMINILKRFVFASKVIMCHWSFFDMISRVSYFFAHMTIVKRRKKVAVHPFRLKKENMSVDFFFSSKS